MGLGKTVQSLALICHVREQNPDMAPFLVVAPASVVANWAAEAARFAPELSVVPISDTLRRSGADLDELAAGAHIVVTSYTLFRLDFDAHAARTWSGLILDEAQYVKNRHAKTYQCARRLAAPFKLAITGTPMENNVMELWSLLSITAPGLFPSPTKFADFYAKPIEKTGDAELLALFRRRIKPLVKRRTKELVAAELPAKQEQVLDIELPPRHRALYNKRLQRERQKVLGLLDDMQRNRFTILKSLTVLRQMALHPGLVDPAHDSLACAKIDALAEHLADVIDGAHRALVFSQFTRFLGRVRDRLDAEEIDYCYLDGRTRNRATVIQRFKDGRRTGFPDQPQGRWIRAQPHRGRLLLPTRPVVESGHRGPGRRPHTPHRPDPKRHGVPAHRPRHHRGQGNGPQRPQGQAVRQRDRRRQRLRLHTHRRGHPRTARLSCAGARALTTRSAPTLNPWIHVEAAVEAHQLGDVMAGHDGNVQRISCGQALIAQNNVLGVLHVNTLNRQHVVHHAEDRIKSRLNRLALVDCHVPMTDLLQHLGVGDEPFSSRQRRLQQTLRIELVRVCGTHQIHRNIGVDQDHCAVSGNASRPRSISSIICPMSAVGNS